MENNNEVKRTQGEWKFNGNNDKGKNRYNEFLIVNKSYCIAKLPHMGSSNICCTSEKEAEANAVFICKAVNEYDKLKEQAAKDKETINSLVVALKDVTFLLGLHGSTIMLEEHEKIYRQAKQLLSKIEKDNL